MATATPLPPPPPAPPAVNAARVADRRAGQLTPGWRVASAAVWVMVFVACTGVWKVSRELGLATWWLGPISEPRPIFVMLVPFAAPAAMVIATLSNARRLPWYGLGAVAVAVAVGLADLAQVRRLGIVELAIAGAAGLVTIASFSGLYRPVLPDRPDQADLAEPSPHGQRTP